MTSPRIKAKSLKLGLPFGLGEIEFEANEVEQRAAWSLYVELITRVAIQRRRGDSSLREALNSLYDLFRLTRTILREAGPAVAHGPKSFGPIALKILNEGLRPFMSKWHPQLQSYEKQCPPDISPIEHERRWQERQEMQMELRDLQRQMEIYAEALAEISGAK